jgi:signal transduction histidine kinase
MAGNIEEHFGVMRTVRTAYFLFVPFLLLASLTGGYILSGRALVPVGKMTAMASRLSITNLRGRVIVPGTGDELQGLAEAWNSLLARLESSVKRSAQFTSDASHDLRTSIAVILASAELALGKERTPEEHQRLFRTVQTECEHTLNLLEDLLLTARYGFEQHQLQWTSLDFAALVRESCLPFLSQAEIKGQSLTFDLADNVRVAGDRSLLHRLIAVLVENALKYTPQGGTVSVRLVPCERQGALLEVCDTGPGIDPGDLPRIFDRHFRSQSSRKAARGSGLGLNIARSIAEIHLASISAQSELKKGSAFQVLFPPTSDLLQEAS